MFANSSLRRLFFVCAVLVLGVSVGHARSVYVEDGGAFFSEQAKAEATRIVSDLERSVKKEVLVETFKEVPADVRQGMNLSDKASVSHGFDQWTEKQAGANKVNGVYILMVQSPKHLQIAVGADTARKAFTNADRDALVNMMLVKLKARQNDEALLDGVNFIATTMRAHLPGNGAPTGILHTTGSQPTSGFFGGGIFKLLVILIGVFLIFRIIGGLFRGGGEKREPLQVGGGGWHDAHQCPAVVAAVASSVPCSAASFGAAAGN